MLSVGCGGVAVVSSVAAVNSFPDLEFSFSGAGPWWGPVHPGGRSRPLNRSSSALHSDGSRMFLCCLLPSSQAPILLVLPGVS